MAWTEYLKDGVLDWLLEESNPSVRFWALQDLEEMKQSSRKVVQAQENIMDSSCVKGIFREQKPKGHWEDFDDAYLPKYKATTHNLLILSELGAQRTDAVERAVEQLFEFQRTSGHFLTKRPKSEKGKASIVKDACCYDGNILFYLLHFGYLADPRTKRLIAFQEDYHAGKSGGWKCRAYPIDTSRVFPENCFMGATKNLKGLARIPVNERSKKLKEIIDIEVENILKNGVYKYLRNPNGTRKDKAGWKKFGFPLFYQADALEVMDTLTYLGVRDDRMQDTIDLLISVQGMDGKWLLKNTYNGKMICEIDEKHQPSKWITLRALRVLKRYYGK